MRLAIDVLFSHATCPCGKELQTFVDSTASALTVVFILTKPGSKICRILCADCGTLRIEARKKLARIAIEKKYGDEYKVARKSMREEEVAIVDLPIPEKK